MNSLSRQTVLGAAAAGFAGVALAATPSALAGTPSALASPAARGRFRDEQFPITAFGADESADCTRAIARAIAACHAAGGGHVVVPPGRWETGGSGPAPGPTTSRARKPHRFATSH